MSNSFSKTLKSFFTFISLFIGTGFISGSIVHFGEGVTIWDTSVLLIGVLLFVSASYSQEKKNKNNNFSWDEFILFILQSLLLAIGIGMASGGTQHYIDTPAYSSVLIPFGLSLGLFSYLWREKISLPVSKWITVFCIVIAIAGILWTTLSYTNTIIPDSLRVGHGSHGH